MNTDISLRMLIDKQAISEVARRVGIHDWQRFEPANDGGFFQSEPRKRGARGREDPSYHKL